LLEIALARHKGWIHADVYAGFNDLYRSGEVHEVACMAHIRRKFTDVFQSEGSVIAEEVIRRIDGRFAVEKDGRRQRQRLPAKIQAWTMQVGLITGLVHLDQYKSGIELRTE
jgi:hypothetical protein